MWIPEIYKQTRNEVLLEHTNHVTQNNNNKEEREDGEEKKERMRQKEEEEEEFMTTTMNVGNDRKSSIKASSFIFL